MSFIRIDKKALFGNLDVISKKASLDKIYVVLKDNAYGHGLELVADLCVSHGVKHAVVRDAKEACLIASKFDSVLVLAETTDFDAPSNVHFAINFTDVIPKIPQNTKVQLKVDSGMHRNGVSANELENAIETIIVNRLELTGVFSHLRSADELSSENFWQEKNFKAIKQRVLNFCVANNLKTPLFHLQNSAGLFRNGTLGEFDMARVGIALYGYMQMPSAFSKESLQPVLSLWADKLSGRSVAGGQAVGYGAVGKVQKDTPICVYDIGYADGFLRVKTDSDYTLPNGSKLLGRVSMDNICVTSSDEQICVFDDAEALAARYGTISYEILVRLNPNIKRLAM
jgi:alanine racemase